jgi:hypothetical protein
MWGLIILGTFKEKHQTQYVILCNETLYYTKHFPIKKRLKRR